MTDSQELQGRRIGVGVATLIALGSLVVGWVGNSSITAGAVMQQVRDQERRLTHVEHAIDELNKTVPAIKTDVAWLRANLYKAYKTRVVK